MLMRAMAVFSIGLMAGCATEWKVNGVFHQTVQTDLRVQSTPQSRVYVNQEDKGETPATIPLLYDQEVRTKSRRVSYWITQPGLALLITVVSLGFYLPFSPIPVDIESATETTPIFRGNTFAVRAKADGYREWNETVYLAGEKTVFRNVVLDLADTRR